MSPELRGYYEYLRACEKYELRGSLILFCGIVLVLWSVLILQHAGFWMNLCWIFGLFVLPSVGIMTILMGAKKVRKELGR